MSNLEHDESPESAQRRQALIAHMTEAHRLAALEGIKDVLRPGFLKELIVSDALGHRPCKSWRDGPGDAYDPKNPMLRFEYFCAPEGKRFQAGPVRRSDWNAKKAAYLRFEKATAVYLAVFDLREPLTLLRIYLVEMDAFRAEVNRQVVESKSAVVNASFSERWAATTGRKVFPAVDLPAVSLPAPRRNRRGGRMTQ